MNETVLLTEVKAPAGVTIVDVADDAVVATLTPPKLGDASEDEIETETEVVGEAAAADATAEAGEGDGPSDAAAAPGDVPADAE
jgi:large subunit ribosomal protein L25